MNFSAFQTVILTRLEEIKQGVKENKSGIETLIARHGVVHEETSGLVVLPISTVDALLELEKWVKESETNRNTLVRPKFNQFTNT